jgi:hypothetical protein
MLALPLSITDFTKRIAAFVKIHSNCPPHQIEEPKTVTPCDFFRCHRLLETFPEWKLRLPEVAQKFPFWTPYMREWANLTALYEHEIKGEDAPSYALSDCMKELEEEARPLKRGKSHWTVEDAA